jgi:hypothetical protein
MAGLGSGPGGDVLSMAAAFRAHVAPSAAAPSTRSKDWAGWRAVLSWATARQALGKVLPMSRTTLEALIWEMLACQCTAPIITGVIDSGRAWFASRAPSPRSRLRSPPPSSWPCCASRRPPPRRSGTSSPHAWPR